MVARNSISRGLDMSTASFGRRSLEGQKPPVVTPKFKQTAVVEDAGERSSGWHTWNLHNRLRAIGASMLAVSAVIFLILSAVRSFDSEASSGAATAMSGQPSEVASGIIMDKIVLNRPSEPMATYTIIGIARGQDGHPMAVNTRYSPNTGWVYTMRSYDCERGRLFTHASAETFEGLENGKPDPGWGRLMQGSAATQVAAIACRALGKSLKGVL